MLGGMWFAYFIFKEQILNSLVSSAVVFMMLQTLPRTQVHKYVFAFMMLCITREKSTLIFMRHIWQSHISNVCRLHGLEYRFYRSTDGIDHKVDNLGL